MKLSDITSPEIFLRQYGSVEIFVPLGRFDKLMQQLEDQGWEWYNKKPTDVRLSWADKRDGYIHLWKEKDITHNDDSIIGKVGFSDWSAFTIDDWGDKTIISSTNYCKCGSPKTEQRFSGIGSNGEWYNFCIGCKKERQ